MRRAGLLLATLALVGCRPNLPGTPDPFNPLVFAPNTEAVVTYTAPCVNAGDAAIFTAFGLPAGSPIDIWISGQGAGGWKIGNPPRPSEYGASRLGTGTTDPNGRLIFEFVVSADVLARHGRGSFNQLAIWLVYPERDGKTPIRPDAASFPACPEDGAAPQAAATGAFSTIR